MRNMEIVDRERHEVLKGMLEDRAREIVTKLKSLRESLPDELAAVKDPEEQSVDEFARGLDFALIEMKSHTLGRINDALQRVEAGSYGLCGDCEQEIGRARLQALPFAERCRDCHRCARRSRPSRRGSRSSSRSPGLTRWRRLRPRAAAVPRGAHPTRRNRGRRRRASPCRVSSISDVRFRCSSTPVSGATRRRRPRAPRGFRPRPPLPHRALRPAARAPRAGRAAPSTPDARRYELVVKG